MLLPGPDFHVIGSDLNPAVDGSLYKLTEVALQGLWPFWLSEHDVLMSVCL